MAGNKKGQAVRLGYTPGQPRAQAERELVPEGDGKFSLKSYGKQGPAGWKVKPGKFPCRHVDYELIGSEGADGQPLSFRDFASSSPKAFFRIFDLAAAVNYPVAFELDTTPTKPSDPGVKQLCEWIDEMFAWIDDNNVVLNGTIKHEEYNGQQNARVQWLPPEEGSFIGDEVAVEEDEQEEEVDEAEEFDPETGEVAEEEVEEEMPAPTPVAKKKAAPAAKAAAPQLKSVAGKKR